jgi:hypothetical protein
VRISCKRSEKLKVAPVHVCRGHSCPRLLPPTLPCQFLPVNICSRLHPKKLPNFLCRYARYPNDFVPAALAGRNGNGRSRHLQKICEEFDAGLIGFAVDRRRGQGDFERVADLAGDRVLSGSGLQLDRYRYAA